MVLRTCQIALQNQNYAIFREEKIHTASEGPPLFFLKSFSITRKEHVVGGNKCRSRRIFYCAFARFG